MKKTAYKKTGFLASVKEIIWILFIVFLIRTFGFGLYVVPTGSMETTMLIGERFFADKFTILFSKPKRGDIISFNDPLFAYSDNTLNRLYQEYIGFPYGPSNWTKRVIGVPGDVIKGVIEDGKPVIYRNGEKIEEPYLNQYPLLGLWIDSLDKLQDRLDIAARQCVTQEEVELVMAREVVKWMDWRSYDASFAFEQQPFYRMNPALVVHIQPDAQGVEGCSLTAEGLLLKKPHTPIPDEGMRKVQKSSSYWNGTDEFYVELGAKQYWCMGDNRRGSFDSRFFGPVDEHLIHGKIIFRIFSLDTRESWLILDLIKHPIGFWSNTRWSRCLQRVR